LSRADRWRQPALPHSAVSANPVDLHSHTTASDGTLSPTALVQAAAARGILALAVTDHDTTAGLDEARRAAGELGLTLIDGIELSTEYPGGTADILGYCFDPADAALQGLLTTIRAARVERAAVMVQRLQALGSRITDDDVLRQAGEGAIGRPHVARALVAEGFVADMGEAFRRYIGPHGPAYAERYKLSPQQACLAIRAAGGVPVLAHPVPPGRPLSDPKRLRVFLPGLVEAGLGGLECHYPGYSVRVVRWLAALAWHFRRWGPGGSARPAPRANAPPAHCSPGSGTPAHPGRPRPGPAGTRAAAWGR